jgi:putative transposase
MALARGIQGFQISAARALNQAFAKTTGRARRGRVFSDRYHAVPLTTPTQVRHAMRYVLNNWRRHREDQGIETMFWDVDYFSSGVSFTGWKELHGASYLPSAPKRYVPLPVAGPRTWLLAEGWQRAGTISMYSVPGPVRRNA